MDDRRQCANPGCLTEPDPGMAHCWRHLIGERTGVVPAAALTATAEKAAERWGRVDVPKAPPKPGKARPIWERFITTREQMMGETARKPYPSVPYRIEEDPTVGVSNDEALKACAAHEARRKRLTLEKTKFKEIIEEAIVEEEVAPEKAPYVVLDNPPGVSLRHELEAVMADDVPREVEDVVVEGVYLAGMRPTLEQLLEVVDLVAEHEAMGADGFDTQLYFPSPMELVGQQDPQREEKIERMKPKVDSKLEAARAALRAAKVKGLEKARAARSAKAKERREEKERAHAKEFFGMGNPKPAKKGALPAAAKQRAADRLLEIASQWPEVVDIKLTETRGGRLLMTLEIEED